MPAKLRAHMPTAEAAQQPAQQSFAQLETVNQRLAQERSQEETLEQQHTSNSSETRRLRSRLDREGCRVL